MSASTGSTSLRPDPPPRTHPGAWLRGIPFDARNNSLNLIRLFLAFFVLVSHSFTLGAFGDEPEWAGASLGGWAVLGFFVLSGYLIMGSRLRTDPASYLMHRVARIFPAFIVCLLVVAFAVAPVAFYRQNGTLSGFLTTPTTPLDYVFRNFFLQMRDYSVAGTPADVPYPGAWNGSLWSLYFEFLCYIVVGVLAFVPLIRRRAWAIGVLFLLSVLAQVRIDSVMALFGGNGDARLMTRLLPYFLGGALLYMLKDRVRYTAVAAIPIAAIAIAFITFFPEWGGQLMAPLLAYALLWLSLVLPAPRWVLRNDVSYGAYIYAFPIQQLMVVLGAHHVGVVLYVAICTMLTAVPATISWYLIERPVMRWVRRLPRVAAGQPRAVAPPQAGSTPG